MTKKLQLGAPKLVQRFNSADLYLALNLKTSDEVVQKLRKALDDVRAQSDLSVSRTVISEPSCARL